MFAVDRVSEALIYQRDVWYRRFAGLLERKARDPKSLQDVSATHPTHPGR
jgi:hypothetical protein